MSCVYKRDLPRASCKTQCLLCRPGLACLTRSSMRSRKHWKCAAPCADKLASITGNVREGSFHDTSRPLPGWKDCTIYGDRTYACNSEDIATAEVAEGRLNSIVQQVTACFGEGWWQNDTARTSPLYVVLHHPVGLATMTISTDEDRTNAHVVRLIMFLAR
jgi:hypothetical protein